MYVFTETYFQQKSSVGVIVKSVQKIRSKFTGEHSCRNMISIKVQSNFIEITLRHGCSPVNLLHIFRAPFAKNISEGLLLYLEPCQGPNLFTIDFFVKIINGCFLKKLRHKCLTGFKIRVWFN